MAQWDEWWGSGLFLVSCGNKCLQGLKVELGVHEIPLFHVHLDTVPKAISHEHSAFVVHRHGGRPPEPTLDRQVGPPSSILVVGIGIDDILRPRR